jgi:hypothetical protein
MYECNITFECLPIVLIGLNLICMSNILIVKKFLKYIYFFNYNISSPDPYGHMSFCHHSMSVISPSSICFLYAFHIFSSPCQRQCELLPSLGIRRPLTFHILIFSSIIIKKIYVFQKLLNYQNITHTYQIQSN